MQYKLYQNSVTDNDMEYMRIGSCYLDHLVLPLFSETSFFISQYHGPTRVFSMTSVNVSSPSIAFRAPNIA